MSAVFSFIIPCFNHGKYLDRCLSSIANIKDIPYEILIVDDGSTEEATIVTLKRLADSGYQVIHQENSGPGAARNNGISKAKGEYIVPLDADDMIRTAYVSQAYELLRQHENIHAVYANYQQFGERNDIMQHAPYSLQHLLLTNNIGACVIFRKSCWQQVGGYDETLRNGLGWEDWDLWLNFAYHGFVFQHLDIIGYDYQYHNQSRERMFLSDKVKVNKIITRFEEKYKGFYAPGVIHQNLLHQLKVHPAGMFLKIFLAAFIPSVYQKLVKKGKIRKYLV